MRRYCWRGIDDPARYEIVQTDIGTDVLYAKGKQKTQSYLVDYELKVQNWATQSISVYISGLCSQSSELRTHYCRWLALERDTTGTWSDIWQVNCHINSLIKGDGEKSLESENPGISEHLSGLLGEEVLNCDLVHSPLTNVMPIRGLGLLDCTVESGYSPVAWIDVPSLTVRRIDQWYSSNTLCDQQSESGVYTGLHKVYYRSSTGFFAELTVDDEGIVHYYPSVAYLENIDFVSNSRD